MDVRTSVEMMARQVIQEMVKSMAARYKELQRVQLKRSGPKG